MAKVVTSNPDHTISLKRLQCVVENKRKHRQYFVSRSVDEKIHSTLIATCTLLCLCPLLIERHKRKPRSRKISENS